MCDIIYDSKYSKHPSPPRPANEPACRGRTFQGNDGNLWTSKMTSTGVYRWIKVSEKGNKTLTKRGVKPVAKTSGVYTISFPLEYIHERGLIQPTRKQLINFYKKESIKEVKDLLTEYTVYNDKKFVNLVKNFKVSNQGIASFTLPKSLSRAEVRKYVDFEITNEGLADGSWEGEPGTGLVYGTEKNGGVIGFGKPKISG